MKAWDQFLRDVLPDVPGCPEPVAEHAILRAAQEFCSKAHVWTVWLDDIITTASLFEYDINLESKSELVQLKRATLNGRPIAIATSDSLPADWKTNAASIQDCIFTTDRKTLTLLPARAAGLVLRIEATLKPSNSAEGLSDDLYDQYVEKIALGAKARLMQQPEKPYSNPAMGQALQVQFNSAMAGVSINRWRGFGSARPRARAKTF